jgi:pimeloyl-ACP methyl ester carboxylesterase
MDRPRRGGFGFNMFTLATLVHQLAFLPFLNDEQRKRILRWVGKHRGFVLDPTPGNEKLIEYFFNHGMECGGSSYLDKVIACGKGRYADKLGGIRVPTLVMRGTEDRLIGAETTLEIAGRIHGAELVLIDGGGHCCTYTMPEKCTVVIRNWLSASGFLS